LQVAAQDRQETMPDFMAEAVELEDSELAQLYQLAHHLL
jgi:hypothetical protein